MRAHADLEPPESQDGMAEPPPETGALRSWVVGGTRRFTINPRRRTGRNSQARQLLASDGTKTAVAHGGWLGLISALQRHTVHDAMTEMPKEDRHILTLAYLHGHSNDEIAQMLNVSVRTVSRRLSIALGKLEEQVHSLGIWMLATMLVLLGNLRFLREHQAVSIATVGVATVVALSVVAANPSAPAARTSSAPATGHSIAATVPGDSIPAPLKTQLVTVSLTSTHVAAAVTAAKPSVKPTVKPSKEASTAKHHRCKGNRTDAPPQVPVGPRGPGPHESPVSHLDREDCDRD